MKVVSIVGARPQFIKAAPVSMALQEAGHQEFLLHTGKNYDYGMFQIFFEELNIPEPDVNLFECRFGQPWLANGANLDISLLGKGYSQMADGKPDALFPFVWTLGYTRC